MKRLILMLAVCLAGCAARAPLQVQSAHCQAPENAAALEAPLDWRMP